MAQQTDSLLSLRQFHALILENHPVAKQASLLTEGARQDLRVARGNFDPKIEAELFRKQYIDKTYYNLFEGALKVPTWLGVDLKAGHENNSGAFLDPSDGTPQNGLWFAGITVPLGQGLITDARRNAVRQAQQLKGMAEADKVKAINKLMLNAAKDYYDWALAYQQAKVAESAITFANERYQAAKQNAQIGEKPAIDTLEALLLLQDRRIIYAEALLQRTNAGLMLSTYIWASDGTERDIVENALKPNPKTFLYNPPDKATLKRYLDHATSNHPDIVKAVAKGKQLDYELKYWRDNLKPKLNFNYNLLSANPAANPELNYIFQSNNYKLGVDFAFPLFLRKERGKLQLTKLKITDNQLEQQNARRQILNTLQQQYNTSVTLASLLIQQNIIVDNYQKLKVAEQQMFEVGESSLFLLNSRETKLLDAMQKQNNLQVKYLKSRAELLWAAGLPEWEW